MVETYKTDRFLYPYVAKYKCRKTFPIQIKVSAFLRYKGKTRYTGSF
jgi:hypothetical protein